MQDSRLLARREVALVRLAGQYRGPGGLWLGLAAGALVGVEVIQHSGSGPAEHPVRVGERVGEVGLDGLGRGIRVEPVQGVAQAFLRFAHQGGARHPAEGVERHRRPVPVRVADQERLQDPVVQRQRGDPVVGVTLTGRDQVAEWIVGLGHQQVVPVVADRGGVAVGIAEPAGQEEVPSGEGAFGLGIVVGIR